MHKIRLDQNFFIVLVDLQDFFSRGGGGGGGGGRKRKRKKALRGVCKSKILALLPIFLLGCIIQRKISNGMLNEIILKDSKF